MANPTKPTQFVKSVTIGGARSVGRLVLLNGELVMSDGNDTSSYNILLDGKNSVILINDGSDDRVLMGKDVGGF